MDGGMISSAETAESVASPAGGTASAGTGRAAPKRKKGAPRRVIGIFPQSVQGPLRNIKWAAQLILLAIYYLVPWIRWDRGPDAPSQMVLVDMQSARMHFMNIEIWPGDLYLATGAMILAALGLFIVTALWGRLWCGFTCPQTVWTDLFMQTERWIEGDRSARIRLAQQPMSLGKASKKGFKYLVWVAISAATGGAFVLYFFDAPTLAVQFFTGDAPMSAYFFTGLLTASTFALAGGAREKVCTHMCPWPRFQSALLDKDSLVVTYQDWRGEPRGKVRQDLRPSLASLEGEGALATGTLTELAEAAAKGVGTGEMGRGDCIDCNQCVAVCPMGIDIRKGLQLECIGCGLCIDACNAIMDKVKRPHGLIAFDSEANHLARSAGKAPVQRHMIRPRTIIYAGLITALSALLIVGLLLKETMVLTVIPDRQPVFVRLSDGSVRNSYTIRVTNKEREVLDFNLKVDGVPGLLVRVEEIENPGEEGIPLSVGEAGVETWRVFVTAPRELGLKGRNDIAFEVHRTGADRPEKVEASYVWGPN